MAAAVVFQLIGMGCTDAATSIASYVVPVAPGTTVTPLLSVGDQPARNGYRLVGAPDGLGARVLPSSKVELYMNHELASPAGLPRAHGRDGSFVSTWTIDASTLDIDNGRDLIQTVDYAGSPASPFTALCSANLAAPDRLLDSATGRGFDGHLFFSGEEAGAGRLFAIDVATGFAYHLPRVGLMAFENFQLARTGSDMTVGVASPDSTPGFLRVYTGTKASTGTPVDRAGLTNGSSHALVVDGVVTEHSFRGRVGKRSPVRFGLTEIDTSLPRTAQLAEAAREEALAFVRVEDSAWDPMMPTDLYFTTTERPLNGEQTTRDNAGGLWRLRFDDLQHPLGGGTLTLLIDGTDPGSMRNPDNIDIDRLGHVLIQEDSNPPGRILAYRIRDGRLATIAALSPANLATRGITVAETSGIIDVAELGFGPGAFLFDVQGHSASGLPTGAGPGTVDELVANGQLSLLRVDWAQAFPSAAPRRANEKPAAPTQSRRRLVSTDTG